MKRNLICYYTLSLLILSHSFLWAQENTQPARIPPGDVIQRAANTWNGLNDYQSLVHQVELHPSGELIERWARITLIKDRAKENTVIGSEQNSAMFRLDFYNQPINWSMVASGEIDDLTPETIYYSDNSQKLYTFKPANKSLTVNWLNESSPIEEFLYIAGFVEFNLEEFKERAYLEDQVYQETLQNVDTYRVKAIPRRKVEDVIPPRLIWFDRNSYLPKKFAVEADVEVDFTFIQWVTNQKLVIDDLIPEIPVDVYFVDHTSRAY